METRMKVVGAAVLLSLCGVVGSAQAGTDHPCRPFIGIDSAVNPPVVAAPVTAWTTVEDNRGSFKSRNTIEACSVKVVVTSPKGRPTTTSVTVEPDVAAGETMTQDECSMYKYLSSIDSKLVQNKTGEAYSTATSMVAKIDSLASTAQLVGTGYAAVRGAAVQVQSCIAINP